jgi:hypothetical protein
MAEEAIIVVPNTSRLLQLLPPGPQGPSASAQVFFVHTQAVASATWTINHNSKRQPYRRCFR